MQIALAVCQEERPDARRFKETKIVCVVLSEVDVVVQRNPRALQNAVHLFSPGVPTMILPDRRIRGPRGIDPPPYTQVEILADRLKQGASVLMIRRQRSNK